MSYKNKNTPCINKCAQIYEFIEVFIYSVNASYDSSKATRVRVPKVHINGKNNIRMEKNVKNQCLVGPMW
jgi:hypothetical protein